MTSFGHLSFGPTPRTQVYNLLIYKYLFSAVLENLRDREEETRQKWASLQEKSCTWKTKIYEKFENAQKMDENLKVIKELCEKAEKESITPEEIDAGTVFVDDVNRKLKNSGTVPPGMIYFDSF